MEETTILNCPMSSTYPARYFGIIQPSFSLGEGGVIIVKIVPCVRYLIEGIGEFLHLPHFCRRGPLLEFLLPLQGQVYHGILGAARRGAP